MDWELIMKRTFSLRSLRRTLHDHYHWVIAVVTLAMLFFYGGAANNLSGLHIIPVTEHLGISRADFSLAGSAQTFCGMASTFLSGFLIARFGTRLTSTLGLLAAAGGYLLLANVESVWMLIFSRGIFGLASGFCSTSAASHITRVWFHRHGGTVLGMITAATGIGGSVMCIFQTAFIQSGGFAASFRFCAVVMLVVAALIVLFIRNTPEEKGLLPLGEGEEITAKRRKVAENIAPGLPMKLLRRRPSFFLMILCTFLSCLSIYTVYSSICPFFLDCGFGDAAAAGAQSAMLLILTFTKVLVGIFSDHFGAKKVTLICCTMSFFALLLLATASSLVTAYAAVVLYTCALPLVTVGTSLIAFSLFGPRAQTQYTGIFLGVITISSFCGDLLSNAIHDLAHSYRPSFLFGALLAVIAFFLYLILYRMTDQDMKRPEAQ